MLPTIATAMVLLASSTSLAQDEEDCGRTRCARARGRASPARRSLADFEFAPAEGWGLSAACACTAITAAGGEAITVTRASSATCLKGGTLSGIANGDLVTCSSDLPRVMPGGDGTGGLGIAIEGQRTNQAVRSEEFENPVWLLGGVAGAAAPIVTADQAVAPDGTSTADRIQFAATSAGQSSHAVFLLAFNSITTGSVFVKGNGGAGTMDICVNNAPAGVTHDCAACPFVAASWTRCVVRNVANANANADFAIGNMTFFNGGVDRTASDVFVWGAQWEGSVFESSYIKTAGAAVNRAEDSASATVNLTMGATWSQAITWVATPIRDPLVPGFLLEPSAATPAGNRYSVYHSASTTLSQYSVVSSVLYETPNTGLTLGVPQRFAAYFDGTTQTACIEGACASTAPGYAPLSPIIKIGIGNYSGVGGGSPAWGVVKKICFDRSLTRCR